MHVKLGEENTVERLLNEHIENFAKGRLAPPSRENEQFLEYRDFEILDKLHNTRRSTKKSLREIITSPDHDNVVLVFSSDK